MLKKYLFIFIIGAFISQKTFSAGTEAAAGSVLGAQAQGAATGAVQNAAISKTAEVTGLKDKIGNFFDTPAGILVVSGIGTVYSGILYNAAAKQEEESKDNVKKIDKLIASYKDSWIAYCPNGRENLAEPDCYCYLDSGAQNPDRTKSQICIDLWAKNSYKLSAVAGDYKGISKFVDPVGCLTIAGQFDESCKCKKFLDSKGNNACQKGTSISIPNSMVGALMSNSGLKEVMNFSANTANGNPRLDTFSNGILGSKAIATNQLLNRMITQAAGNSAGGKAEYANEKNVGSLAKSLFGEKNIAAAVASSQPVLGSVTSAPVNPKAAELLKATAAKAGLAFTGSGRGLSNKKGETKEAFAFNLNGDSAAANGAGQLQDFPAVEKTYKIKGDISKDKGASIFDIISNRYIQSGLKRLFEE